MVHYLRRRDLRYLARVCTIVALILLLGIAGTGTYAQSGGILSYGSNVSGRIAPESPLALYNFSGNAGDLVTVRALGISDGLNPSITLITPDQTPLYSNDDYPLGDVPTDSFASVFLPQSGVYGLLLGSSGGTTGDYLLQLNGRSPLTNTDTLLQDSPVLVDIPPRAPKQFFIFDALDCPTTLTLTNQSPGTPFSFPYVAKLRGQTGDIVGEVRGGSALQDRITVPARSGRYEVEVYAADELVFGVITLVITCADQQPTCVTPILPLPVFPTPTPTATAPAGQILFIQNGGTLNAPRTDIFGSILPASPLVNYNFDGAVGDLVTVQVIAVATTINPTVQLLSPTLSVLKANDDDPLGFNPGDAGFSFVLTESGLHNVLVGAEDGSGGDYLLRFQKRRLETGTVLQFGQPVTVDVPPPSPQQPPPNVPQYFSFTAQDCPTTLTIYNLTGGSPFTFPFSLKVRSSDGEIVAKLQGGRALEDRVTIAPNSGTYEVEIYSGDPLVQGQLQLLVTCGEGAPGCGDWGDNPRSTPRPGTPVFTPTPTDLPGSPTPTPTWPPCPEVVLYSEVDYAKQQAPYRQATETPDVRIIVPLEPVDGRSTRTPDPTRQELIISLMTLFPLLTATPEGGTWPPLSPAAQTLVSYLTATPTGGPAEIPPDTVLELEPIRRTRLSPTPTATASATPTISLITATPSFTPSIVPSATPTATPTPCASVTPTRPPTRPPTIPPPTVPIPTQPIPFCGDGICQFNEGVDNCDCRVDCANDPNWNAQCFPPPPTDPPPPPTVPPPTQPVPFCGDGICTPGVDDCNCSVDCGNDPNWINQCFPPQVCGDGICTDAERACNPQFPQACVPMCTADCQ